MNNKGAGQTAQIRRLICAFVVRIWHILTKSSNWPLTRQNQSKSYHFQNSQKSAICQKSLSEISNYHEQNHFITKAYDWRNTFIQKWTLFQHNSGCYGSKYQNVTMQILVNFENGDTRIHRYLLCVMYWIMLNLLVEWFTDIFAYLDMQT